MDLTTRSLLDQALTWLPESRLSRVEYWEPGCWRFWFGNGGTIMTGGRWRIVQGSKFLTGSDDHGRKTGHRSEPLDARSLSEQSLLDKKVIHCVVADGTFDLSVEFEGHTRFELINFSMIGDIWEISGPNGEMIVAQPAGGTAIWLRRST